jgi:hypothetical protein
MVGKTHVVFGLTTLAAANAATRFIQPHPIQEIQRWFCVFALLPWAPWLQTDAEKVLIPI